MAGIRHTSSATVEYEIKVRGKLDESWSHWFSGLAVLLDSPGTNSDITTLKGVVVDQASLRGILTRLWDLNLEIISVKQITSPDK